MFQGLSQLIDKFFSMFQLWVEVTPWEHAVRSRLGKYIKKLGPGFHIKLPIIDVVYKQSTRARRSFVTTQTLSTKDGANLIVGGSMAYTIDDIEKLYRTLHHAESTIVQAAAAEIASYVFTLTKAEIDPKDIGQYVTTVLKKEFESYGLGNIRVDITDFAFIRAYRLVNDQRYSFDAGLSTSNPISNHYAYPA